MTETGPLIIPDCISNVSTTEAGTVPECYMPIPPPPDEGKGICPVWYHWAAGNEICNLPPTHCTGALLPSAVYRNNLILNFFTA